MCIFYKNIITYKYTCEKITRFLIKYIKFTILFRILAFFYDNNWLKLLYAFGIIIFLHTLLQRNVLKIYG